MSVKFDDWSITEDKYFQEKINHSETIFTIGNGYLGTRGTFEEYVPSEIRSTFLHGIFDDVPVFFTELANAPDWTELEIFLDRERFSITDGRILSYERRLDLKTATLRRNIRWESPKGLISTLVFERFASLDNTHLCGMRVKISPENYEGMIEVRSGLNGSADNLGFKHWDWINQGTTNHTAWLDTRTHNTNIELAIGVHQTMQTETRKARTTQWDVHNHPSLVTKMIVKPGEIAVTLKWVSLFSSREIKKPLSLCRRTVKGLANLDWDTAYKAHCSAWQKEWDRCDIIIEGDPEAQSTVRFNIFQLLIAGPRLDEHVNIGAKTLSGYGYRGHSFWDTEIFMLPFFSFTRPDIARNLLSYRWHNLPNARRKAFQNGFQGAQFPWESADTGEEVTPTWVPDQKDHTKLIRIWTGDIEIHISADIAFAIWQYWKISNDSNFLALRGAEVVIETARFWATRVEWKNNLNRYEINDIIGPDEYHDHVNNNFYTNAIARWNLQNAIKIIEWMDENHPQTWKRLSKSIKFNDKEINNWQQIIDSIFIPFDEKTRLIEQFEGYFSRMDVDLLALEPRTESIQSIFGIEGTNATQVIKQPDVLMHMFMFPELYDLETVRANYVYYTARTDLTYGSSLGPSIQTILACRVGDPAAYEHFMRAARADLFDVRSNASDGIHGASAGGLWQAVVFGFAGLHISEGNGKWQINPVLPSSWTRLAFKIVQNDRIVEFDIHK